MGYVSKTKALPTEEPDMIELNEVDITPTETPRDAQGTSDLPATDKQNAYIKALVQQRELDDDTRARMEWARQRWQEGRFNRRTASRLIDVLLDCPRKVSAPVESSSVPSSGDPADPVELDGMHKFGGVIFKVQRAVHGSGGLYAKALTEDGKGGWTFEYAPGAITNLTGATKLSLDEAKEFGWVYGTCVYCGRTLTNEESIAYGMGPICRGKFL